LALGASAREVGALASLLTSCARSLDARIDVRVLLLGEPVGLPGVLQICRRLRFDCSVDPPRCIETTGLCDYSVASTAFLAAAIAVPAASNATPAASISGDFTSSCWQLGAQWRR
jgi:hypothetical protein